VILLFERSFRRPPPPLVEVLLFFARLSGGGFREGRARPLVFLKTFFFPNRTPFLFGFPRLYALSNVLRGTPPLEGEVGFGRFLRRVCLEIHGRIFRKETLFLQFLEALELSFSKWPVLRTGIKKTPPSGSGKC